MYPIVNKQVLARQVKRIDITAPWVAKAAAPGQFVMVVVEEKGEWIPLTIFEADGRRGQISLVFQESGPTTRSLGALSINDNVYAIMGPFGKFHRRSKEGVVCCVASGIAVAQILPICRAFKKAGNKVVGIMGAGSKQSMMLETQMRITCHKLIMATQDGSFERRGRTSDILREFLEQKKANLVYAIGTPEELHEICQLTRGHSLTTRVQVNPIMFCGNGICGSCRVLVNGQVSLACQDGPEFDGHQIDYNDLSVRMKNNSHETGLSSLQLSSKVTKKIRRNQENPAPLSRFISEILRKSPC